MFHNQIIIQISRFFFLVFTLIFSNVAFSQSDGKDFKDVMRQWKGDSSLIKEPHLVVGKTYIDLLPVVGYSPANGFILGAAISMSRLFGLPPTNLSSGMINGQVTSKRQFIMNARTKIYLAQNQWFLQGDWRLLLFQQPTYGLGIRTSGTEGMSYQVNNLPQDENLPPAAENLKYRHVRIYEEAVRKIGDSHYYAGLGIAYDHHYNITDEMLVTDTASPDYFITSHYAYSQKNGYNPDHYSTHGIKVTALTDTRDNIINSYKGYYVSMSLQFNMKLNDNMNGSNQFLYDARYYLGLDPIKPRHVLAFWSWGTFLLSGTMPYLALPSIGWDTYNRSGRGYIQGRYRGLSIVYNEAEYRFPISSNGLFGGVAFINATAASDYDEPLFRKVAIGLGAGLRMQLDKRARTNLTVDLGYGANKSGGIYFNLQEMF